MRKKHELEEDIGHHRLSPSPSPGIPAKFDVSQYPKSRQLSKACRFEPEKIDAYT
jgi:hypothetical protein